MTFDTWRSILTLQICDASHWHLRTHILCFLLTLQGVVGSLTSGKSALVHRYLTGSYMQEESPEGKSFAWTPPTQS